jgi:hypothetical protein
MNDNSNQAFSISSDTLEYTTLNSGLRALKSGNLLAWPTYFTEHFSLCKAGFISLRA